MNRAALVFGLLLFVLAAPAALSKPDLVVSDLSIQPVGPAAGETVTLSATVRNVGTDQAVGSFNVRFQVDGILLDSPAVPFGLDVGRQETVSVRWTAEPGTHTITAEADQPFDRIDETSERNNTLVATVVVRPSPSSLSPLSDLKVAVARFEDRSGSGFINVGEGVADELIGRLVTSGVRVLERSELEAVLQERGLNPSLTENLAAAGQILGADLLIVGSVTKVDVKQSSFSLGFFSVSSAAVEISMSARLVSVYTSEILRAVEAQGKEEGSTGFSVDVGKIVALAQPLATSVCAGGLQTDKPSYYAGETVHVGYRNPGAPGWLGVEVYTGGGTFVRWLGWQFTTTGGCGEWFWDQRDVGNVQMSPGMYTVKLWDGTSYIAQASLLIKPGSGSAIPLVNEITVGSGQFDETIVGKATNAAVNQLVTRLIQGMEEVAPSLIAARSSAAASASVGAASRPAATEGEVADVLPDGRVVINVGASRGVSVRDFFQVLTTANVIRNPATGELLAYDVLGVKGEIVIVEVRDRASYGVRTTPFDVRVGDIVRQLVP